MNWFSFALLCALSVAGADALCKGAMAKSGTCLVAWVRVAYAAPFLLALIPFIEMPALDLTFAMVCCVLLPIDLLALLLYIKAISVSPLSLTLPFLALTPVFLIGTSFLLLGEFPGKIALCGIFLVVAGAYLLNVHTRREGLAGPFKSIFREKGSVLMIIVAFLFSISSCLGKIAVSHSSPMFFCMFDPVAEAAIIFLILIFKYRTPMVDMVSRPALFFAIGCVAAVAIGCHFKAISMVDVAYMISVKRTSMVFGVIFGAVFFKESNIRERLLGCAVMVAGVMLISMF